MATEQDAPFIVFGAPDIRSDEIDEIVATLESGWIGTGPRVAQFEQEFAAYKSVPPSQAAAVNSCTAALHVSMVAADLQPGDEVITTAMTFCATANAIISISTSSNNASRAAHVPSSPFTLPDGLATWIVSVRWRKNTT